ncbi:MAG: heavy metal-responsive transcriptional regulator [Gammaproteobacteria bacterium]|nr:heavy metal-responsive transcriptional regulator [Gammaproteobacteria bacterium]
MTMLTRGRVAAQIGCNVETIRYYEKVGIIPSPRRTPAGYRVYDEEHVERLQFILRAKELGFSAERIRELLNLSDEATRTRADVKSLTEQHIQEVSNKIRDLKKLKKRLDEISSHCDGSGKSAKTCPILISLFRGE